MTETMPLKTAKAQAIADLLNGGTAYVYIYTGTPPGADQTATGNLLVTMTLPTTRFEAAANGAIVKTGTWTGIATADGTAGYWRIVKDTNVLEGTLGTSSADMIVDDTAVTTDGTFTVNTFTYTCP